MLLENQVKLVLKFKFLICDNVQNEIMKIFIESEITSNFSNFMKIVCEIKIFIFGNYVTKQNLS